MYRIGPGSRSSLVALALGLALVVGAALGGCAAGGGAGRRVPSSKLHGAAVRGGKHRAVGRPVAASAAPSSAAAVVLAPHPTPGPAVGVGVVAEAPAAARVAMQILARGGSAADAAVAAMLVAGVVQPVSSGLGGGGLALYYDARQQRATVLDFLARAPAGLVAADLGGPPPPVGKRGVLVAVPGELAGLEALRARWGRLPLSELLAPAMRLAREGFVVGHHMHRSLRWNRAWVLGDALARAEFAPAGKLARAGERVRNPTLASALEELATGGTELFYHGPLGRDLLARARAAGSRMVQADLESYRVIERKPLGVVFDGQQVLVSPPPSAGGLLVAETLAMHRKEQLAALGYGSGAYLHVLAETFRGAVADRVRAIGDPDFIKMDLPALLAPARLAARRATIALDRARLPEAFTVRDGGTANVIAVDAAGNVAVVSSAVGHMFGARVMSPAGFPLNDALTAFTEPRQRQRFGAGLRPNLARGGARPVSSMTPLLVLREGRPSLALAASGGTRIGPAVTQALLARLVFARPPAACVGDLRMQAPPTGGLGLEPSAPAPLRADLQRRGEVVMAGRPDYSAVSLMSIDSGSGGRRLEAAADPRKGGLAITR